VRIFRVDNPHTKPFALWEWVIGEIKQEHPDAIFLAEAFTRPKIMHRLAAGLHAVVYLFQLAQQQR
jgi:starch synthase (maltosyl-transferring)